ncbi:MAG: DUF2325 domain-containing protein [Pseudomonadota bacterium]
MNPLAQIISSAFPGSPGCLCSPDDVPVAALRRRRKLWDLPHAYHCALIGTCLPVAKMRRLAPQSGFDVSNMSDYSLHTVVVGYCENRCALTEAIQRFFDKRHAQAIARFAPATDAASVGAIWHESLARGEDIPGALWAAWTHAATDEDVGRDIHGGIHMLSHQAGATALADLRQLEQHRADAIRLRGETDALRRDMSAARQARDQTVVALRRDLAAAEQRAAQYQGRELELAAAARSLQQQAGLQQRAAALAARVELLERRDVADAQRIAQLEGELHETRAELAAAEAALVTALGDGAAAPVCGRDCPPGPALEGRCVLCVGGRSGLVEGYRKLVEHRGGRFLHHDGGQEESLHRIDAAIANADAVVCQSACVSHAAYWRLKEACKKLGKPCVFVQSPGVGSFARSLSALADAAPTDQVIRISF